MTTVSGRTTSVRAMLLAFFLALLPALAIAGEPLPVDDWSIYGGARRYHPDADVPGAGAVTVAARTPLDAPWSRAASLPLAQALRPGERISAVFWARAERSATVPVLLLARDAPYAELSRTVVTLTPSWQRFTVTASAGADLAAGSQALAVQLGQAGADVDLGPVLWVHGEPVQAEIDAAFAGFRPPGLAQDLLVPAAPGVTLAATLRTPRGQGPFPVVLLLSGNGPSQRGVYRLLADRLLLDGIATFEYDKRGAGESTGAFLDTVPLMREDAMAAVAYLRTRPEVDARRIALLGMSQGGAIVPGIAARDPSIAAVVTMAGPVGARGEAFMAGLRSRLAEAGTPPASAAQTTAAVKRWMEARSRQAPPAQLARLRGAVLDALMAGGANREQAQGMTQVFDSPVLLSMYESDTAGDFRRVRAPVLAMYAGEDEVLAADSVAMARAALGRHRNVTLAVLPGLNHVFQPAGAAPAGQALPAVSAPEARERVAAWLKDVLHP